MRIETGCTLVPLMHTPKAAFHGDTPPSLADIFGSVSTANTLDFVHILRPLKVKAKRGEDEAEEEDTREQQPSGLVEVHCRKLRSAGAALPPPRVGRLAPVALPDGLGTSVRFDWVDGATPGSVKADLRLAALEEKVLRHLAANACMSANQVLEGLRGNRKDVLAAVKRLQATGRLGRDHLQHLRPSGGGSGGSA